MAEAVHVNLLWETPVFLELIKWNRRDAAWIKWDNADIMEVAYHVAKNVLKLNIVWRNQQHSSFKIDCRDYGTFIETWNDYGKARKNVAWQQGQSLKKKL